MKFIGLIAMLLMGCALFAGDIKINGEFKQVKNNMPVGWVQNKGKWAEPFGTVKIVKITEADGDVENALQVTSTEKRTDIYTAPKFPVTVGEVYEIEVKAKGTGKIRLGFYGYDEQGKWLCNQSEVRAISPEFKEYKVKIPVKEVKQGEAMVKPARVCFYFSAEVNSDVTIKEIEVDKAD